ncbi:unnamed protein product [Pleuronectes platessa]|uniref:Uncharacterized protein n=1 Tax=Pleuronectes platessa TaxID=8262 RepID=A0A9N7VVZ9_PLEPL|nr:unnamed protein product [Pleuronectes platessa]
MRVTIKAGRWRGEEGNTSRFERGLLGRTGASQDRGGGQGPPPGAEPAGCKQAICWRFHAAAARANFWGRPQDGNTTTESLQIRVSVADLHTDRKEVKTNQPESPRSQHLSHPPPSSPPTLLLLPTYILSSSSSSSSSSSFSRQANLQLCPSAVGSLRSRTPSPVTGRTPAHNFLFPPSTRSLRAPLTAHSFRFSALSSRLASLPPLVSPPPRPRSFSGSGALLTHSSHSTDSSHIPLKGPMQDQVSAGVRPPSCAGAAQDIALRLARGFPPGCKHSLLRGFFELQDKALLLLEF